MSLIRRTQIEEIIGQISSNNSTSTPLISAATFTGEADDVSGYKAIGVYIHSDVAGQICFQFSSDGVNWDRIDSIDIPANTGGDAKFFQLAIVAEYFRICYTNGATNQSEFRLQTILHPVATIPDQQRIADVINDDTFVTLAKNVIAANTVDMGYRDIVATRQGRLKVSEIEVDEGNTWTYANSFQLPPGFPAKFMVIPPSAGRPEKLRFSYKVTAPRAFSVEMYEDAITTNDGFEGVVKTRNRFREYNGVPKKTFLTTQQPTVAASGTQLAYWVTEGGGTQQSGIGNRPGDYILKNGSKYMFKIKNLDVDFQWILIEADFVL
jgi:hypothetical protein